MARQSKYTKEFLEPIVKESSSLRDVARKLKLVESVATRNLKPHIIRLDIDTSHFKRVKRKQRFTDDEVFRVDSMLRQNSSGRNSLGNSGALWKRLKNYKPYECFECGNTGIWNDKELGLDVHHINANNTDNRLENLVFLCPNCHSQTDSFKGKKQNRKETIDETN